MLGAVKEAFLRDYASISLLPRERVETFLSPLDDRLPLHLKELFRNDPGSARQLGDTALLEKQAANTCLKNYYSRRGASPCISDWCYKVEKRVRDVLQVKNGGDVCARCKLRHLPPCS
jgi:hypothetical protein